MAFVQYLRSILLMDQDTPYLGNSPGNPETNYPDGRGRLHVKIANKNSEPIPVSVSVNQTLNAEGLQSLLTVTTTPSIVKVGASNMIDRTLIIIQPQSGKIRHGFVGISASLGFELMKNQYMSIQVGPDLDYYIVAESGSVDVLIAEAK